MISILACGSNTDKTGDMPTDFKSLRARMVESQLVARDIKNKAVLDAMREVPRHKFVAADQQGIAYGDHPVGIGHGQTISQPYVVAYMTEKLSVEKGEKVLEIGTGSGYQAAVLANMGIHVYSIEIVEPLGLRAKEVFNKLGYKVQTRIGDGYKGWPEEAPFDGIIVTAAPKSIPPPLVDQLKEGGRLVIPVGNLFQDLRVLRKTKDGLEEEDTLPVRFVPMTGTAEQD